MLLERLKRHLLNWLWANYAHSWWQNTFDRAKGSINQPPFEVRTMLKSTNSKDLINEVRNNDALFERGKGWWKIVSMLRVDGQMFLKS